ncbi:hypothetical protein CL52_19575 [Stutzerimonas balearica DSM 6083]|uniref:Uncharacterized protein n=1 Tax=Stutzerimonas balearica DSM 6083 TaxID=1123016 RepID=A0A8D3Y563_9GAMM|nr:hypothetical protein CL52_19575 [Stutzerimonas balearica DSM 6083]
MVTWEDQLETPGKLMNTFQQRQCLPAQGHKMWSTHFGSSAGMFYALDSLALGGDRPQCACKINFIPTRKAQLTRADEYLQSDLNSQAC